MNEKIINILSNVPKEILINCVESLIIKKNNTLVHKIKQKQSLSISKPNMSSGSKNVMLAHPYDPDKHSKKIANWWMSIKYDGVRGKWNGDEMESRTGKIYSLPDFITEQLQKITEEDGSPMQLDGEIWFGNDTFAIASGAARRFENDPILWKQMTYMIFDTPNTEIPFEERIEKIKNALDRAGNIPNIKIVNFIRFDTSKMDIQEELTRVEEDGGEGIVLRKPKSSYVFARSHDMLKVKSWSYKEAVVTGYVEGTGRLENLVGSLMVKSDQFGDEDEESTDKKWVNFKVGSGLNDWQRYSGNPSGNWKTKDVQNKIDEARKKFAKKIDKNNEHYKTLLNTIKNSTGKEKSDALHELNNSFTEMPYIGSVVTFRFKELTKDGNPSFPTFVGVRDYE